MIEFQCILYTFITAIMGKTSKKTKSEAKRIENENNLMRRYESISEMKQEEDGLPGSEDGNKRQHSPMSGGINSKTFVGSF